MSIDDMIAVLQAAKAGKQIERRFTHNDACVWYDFRAFDPLCLNSHDYDYRVKPEPREWWLVENSQGYYYAYDNVAGMQGAIKVREVLP